MSSKIQKWRNSAGIKIPKTIMEQANLDLNSKVKIGCKN